MFNQYDDYLLEREYRNKQFDFMTEAAQQELVKSFKQGRQCEFSSRYSLRYMVGEIMLKLGGWLTNTSKLEEI